MNDLSSESGSAHSASTSRSDSDDPSHQTTSQTTNELTRGDLKDKSTEERGTAGSILPQTPRGLLKTPKGVTPYSFGLSFLPSFSFNSPVYAVSPNRFFNINNLNKFFHRKLDSVSSMGKDVFGLSTPAKPGNKFLDSLTKESDMWSTFPYEEDKKSEFLTPRKLLKGQKNDVSPNKHNLEVTPFKHENLHLTPFKDLHTPSKSENSQNHGGLLKQDDLQLTPFKETPRRLSHINLPPIAQPEVRDMPILPKITISEHISKKSKLSPNNSIASQIDSAIDSPRKNVSSTISASKSVQSAVTPSSLDNERVWHPELDQILIGCFIKYRDFRETHTAASANIVLKNTSQNKILLRMLFNKTGILRTSKQISSRLFRLTKSKKLEKQSKYCKNYTTRGFATPNPTPATATGKSFLDSIKTNEILDDDLDMLLSSPTIGTVGEFTLHPKIVQMSYKNGNEEHVFTRLGSVSDRYTTLQSITKSHPYLDGSIMSRMESPIWMISHNINVKLDELNIQGQFESFMKLSVSTASTVNMLNWKCYTQVFDDPQRSNCIYLNIDLVNGYKKANGKYELNQPFMKTFFRGYINFLINGSMDHTPLTMTQVIFNNSLDEKYEFTEESKVHGYFVHDVKFSDEGNFGSNFEITRIGKDDQSDDEDDNETVLADSSPYKSENEQREHVEHSEQLLNGLVTGQFVNGQLVNGQLVNGQLVNGQPVNVQHELNDQTEQQSQREELIQRQQHEIQKLIREHQNQQNQLTQNMQINHNQHSQQTQHVQHIQHIQHNQQMQLSHPPLTFSQSTSNINQLNNFNQQSNSVSPEIANYGMLTSTPKPQEQIMVNLGGAFVPFHSLHPKVQEQYIMNKPAPVQNNYFPYNSNSAPASQTQFFPGQPTGRALQPKNLNNKITFGPILEYDPSKDTSTLPKAKNGAIGTHRFPVNTPLNMYKPKKR